MLEVFVEAGLKSRLMYLNSCSHFINSLNPVKTAVNTQFLWHLGVVIPRRLGKFSLSVIMKGGRAPRF